jgi:hypothetical protein
MPDHVRTGDIWQVVGQDHDESYVAVVAGMAGYDTRPFFTVAGTSPDVEFLGPGDLVVDGDARGIRVGYAFMLCTWSFAGVPEMQFEQYLGRVSSPARRALVAAHRNARPRADRSLGLETDPVSLDSQVAIRGAFRARLQRRLEVGLIATDPREAQLPIRSDAILDRRPPAWLVALTSWFGPNEIPPPYEVARILHSEGVRWLPSTKRRVKWLFRQYYGLGDWVPQTSRAPETFLLPSGDEDDFQLDEVEVERRLPRPDEQRERAAEAYAHEVERILNDWLFDRF